MEYPQISPLEGVPLVSIHERILAIHRELHQICIGALMEQDPERQAAIVLDLRRLFQLNLAVLRERGINPLD